MATCNLFISGGFSDNAPRYNRLVDTSFPVIQLDVTESYTITLNNKVTSFPVESRSSIADHIYSENIKISFEATIGLADPYYSAYSNLIKGDKSNVVKANRPKQAYDLLKKLRDERLQIDILTEQELFEGVVITDLSVSKTGGDDQLKFSIGLEKVRFVEVGKTVLASLAPATTNKTTKNQAATKKAEGSKPSGDTTEAEKKVTKAINAGGIAGDALNWAVKWSNENLGTSFSEDVVQVEQ